MCIVSSDGSNSGAWGSAERRRWAMTQPAQPSGSDHQLRVVIRIEPEKDCPVVHFDGKPEHIQAQLAGDTCLSKAIVKRSETVVEQTETDVDDGCVCSVFHDHACVAAITTYVSDREVLEDLIGDLEDVGTSIELMEIVSNYDGHLTDRVERVDLSSLTDKQREAAELAIEMGYYKRPREASLEEIADELDISQQALSQRLGAVEEKLITQLFTSE